jgi:hypothetical protein
MVPGAHPLGMMSAAGRLKDQTHLLELEALRRLIAEQKADPAE